VKRGSHNGTSKTKRLIVQNIKQQETRQCTADRKVPGRGGNTNKRNGGALQCKKTRRCEYVIRWGGKKLKSSTTLTFKKAERRKRGRGDSVSIVKRLDLACTKGLKLVSKRIRALYHSLRRVTKGGTWQSRVWDSSGADKFKILYGG